MRRIYSPVGVLVFGASMDCWKLDGKLRRGTKAWSHRPRGRITCGFQYWPWKVCVWRPNVHPTIAIDPWSKMALDICFFIPLFGKRHGPCYFPFNSLWHPLFPSYWPWFVWCHSCYRNYTPKRKRNPWYDDVNIGNLFSFASPLSCIPDGWY